MPQNVCILKIIFMSFTIEILKTISLTSLIHGMDYVWYHLPIFRNTLKKTEKIQLRQDAHSGCGLYETNLILWRKARIGDTNDGDIKACLLSKA